MNIEEWRPVHRTAPEHREWAFLIVAVVAWLFVVLILLVAAAESQTIPAATATEQTQAQPTASKSFFALALASGIATAADCSTTNHLIQTGPQFREANPLLGARPSPLRISLTCGSTFGAVTWSSYALKRGRRGRWWIVPPALVILANSVGFAHNRAIYPHTNPTMRLTRFSATTAPSR